MFGTGPFGDAPFGGYYEQAPANPTGSMAAVESGSDTFSLGGAATTLNPLDKISYVTLSNGDLTATKTTAGSHYSNTRSTTSKSGEGFYVVRVENISGSTQHALGLANSDAGVIVDGNWLGIDANSFGVYYTSTGEVWGPGGSQVGNFSDTTLNDAGFFAAFEILATTVNITVSTDGSTWASARTVTRPSGDLFVTLGLYTQNDAATMDFSPTGWTLAGAENWDGATGEGIVTITGTMAATESGADVASPTGVTVVTGSMSATESGADTVTFAGNAVVTGTLAVAESGGDIASASGVSEIEQAATTPTESGSDAFASTGAVPITGAMAAVESGADTFSGEGSVADFPVTGAMAAVESGDDIFSASGTAEIEAEPSTPSEVGADTFAATGGTAATGVLTATEAGQDEFAGTGAGSGAPIVPAPPAQERDSGRGRRRGFIRVVPPLRKIQGVMAARESGEDVFRARGRTGSIRIRKLSLPEPVFPAPLNIDIRTAPPSLPLARIKGSLRVQEGGGDRLRITGRMRISGSGSAREGGADTFIGEGRLTWDTEEAMVRAMFSAIMAA